MIGRLLSRDALLAVALLLLITLVSLRFPDFATPVSLLNVFNDTSILIILTLGQMAVILTRCIDLSMASNLALVGMITAMLNAANPDIPVIALLMLALILGALLGGINGLLIWKLDIPSIVVTLGTLTIFRGLIFLLSEGQWVNAHEMSPAFKAFPRYSIAGLPVLSWITVLEIACLTLFFTRTDTGRSLYAVGGNPSAATYTGIDVGRARFNAFVLSGALSGMAGYLWVSRYAVAYVDIAAGFELEIVAACVIGGISIAGGLGTVSGAVLGALFLGVIKNALPVINISPFWQQAISGMAILIAVIFNARSERRKGRLILKEAEQV